MCFVKDAVLRNFAKFTGKHQFQSLFLIKLQASGLTPASLLKKRLRHKCFPSNFAKFLRTPPVAASGSLFSQDHQLRQVTSSIYIVHCTGKKLCVYHVRGSHFY